MFSSLANRNFRIYFYAVSFSVVGTFAQELALAWLVLDLTHSAGALGLALGLQYLPMLLFAPWGGVLSDRYNRRKLLMASQAAYAVSSFALWALASTHLAQIWMVYLLAVAIGLTAAINTPTRMALLHDLVGSEHLAGAVSLNASVYSAGRVVGPAIAGIIITLFGVAPAFFLNGITYLAMIYCLIVIRHGYVRGSRSTGRLRGQVWEALRYVSKTPSLLATLTMVLIVGTFTYEYSVSLPALARLTFNGSAATLALLTSSFGLGAVVGGLINARGGKPDPTALPSRIVLLAAASLLLALCSNLILAVAAVMLLGFSSIRFSAFANSALQLTSAPAMRGRVLAFFSSAWVGSTAIGGPLVGWIAQHAGGRWAVAFGGVTALAAAAIGLAILQITDRKTA